MNTGICRDKLNDVAVVKKFAASLPFDGCTTEQMTARFDSSLHYKAMAPEATAATRALLYAANTLLAEGYVCPHDFVSVEIAKVAMHCGTLEPHGLL